MRKGAKANETPFWDAHSFVLEEGLISEYANNQLSALIIKLWCFLIAIHCPQ